MAAPSGWRAIRRGGMRLAVRCPLYAWLHILTVPTPFSTRGDIMQKRPNAVTFKGNPITLVGPQLKAGDAAPDFACLKVLDTVTLASTPGKVRLFSVVP